MNGDLLTQESICLLQTYNNLLGTGETRQLTTAESKLKMAIENVLRRRTEYLDAVFENGMKEFRNEPNGDTG